MSENEELLNQLGEEGNGADQASEPDYDVSELETLTFGTRWTKDENENQKPRDRRPSFNNRNNYRNSRRGPSEFNSKDRHREHSDRPGKFFNRRPHERRIFIPAYEVQFYQEDTTFDALLEDMKKSGKTYELFGVAKSILQQPERFVAVVRRRPNKEGVVAPLYLSLLDDLPFESEHEVMIYILQHHIDEFFEIKEEAIEAPKGRFTCVHRCGITGKLLSAPNYHRYKNILRDHFNAEIRSMPFERFVSKIETTNKEEDIQQWLQNMSKKITYIPRAIDETVTDLEPIETLEGVKNYLLKYYRDRLLREVNSVRVLGTVCETLPSFGISKAIRFFLQKQRQFPLDTANNLRNRFRRAGFGIYRKGKLGITYVCASKRKFRTDSDVFTPDIQSLINYLEPLEKTNLADVKSNYIEAQHLDEQAVIEGLNWLIHEGYVVEYENGDLYLNPKLVTKPETTDENNVIPLMMQETTIEKLSDGTITVAQETQLITVDEPSVETSSGKLPEEENSSEKNPSADSESSKTE